MTDMVSTGLTGGTADEDRLPEETLAELRQITTRYPQARSALLPMLHLVQSVEGRVTSRGIEACADILGISAAEVSGVATFYTMYKRRPVGDYHVGVCTNTLCAVMGGDAIFERLKDHLDVGNDETTEDGRITLEHLECNAACDYAPVMMVNWEFMDNMDPQSATQLVDDLREGKEVRSTRGPRICTWREAERVLAGFPDDRADEGPAAGHASLVGLAIAREHDWKAPDSGRRSVSSGSGDPGKVAAADQADTRRAESETEVEQSPAHVEGGPEPETGSAAEADGKGGSQ
jgi:NADH-quinone oxidoreductase subunit E